MSRPRQIWRDIGCLDTGHGMGGGELAGSEIRLAGYGAWFGRRA
jgi:hypothetical protein